MAQPNLYEVELPAGGRLPLQTQDEVDFWENTSRRYQDDYAIDKQNDLLLLGAILSQALIMFRAQQRLAGMEPELDGSGVPTGRYKAVKLKQSDEAAAHSLIAKAAGEIRELEKSLGVDKKTREAGGQHTVANYISMLKKVGREYGVHLSQRLTEYERVMMELRWKLRVLHNGDAEDRQYHNLTPNTILDWLTEELDKLEDIDRQFANTKQKLYLGRI